MTLGRIHYQWGYDKMVLNNIKEIVKYKRNCKNRNKKKKLTVGNDQRDDLLAP